LRYDIKSIILVQRPKDLDTACPLTLLQEKSSSANVKTFKNTEHSFSARSFSKGAFPLPRPPAKEDNTTDTSSKGVGQKQQSVEE
jgi:hypothetical protein